VGQFRPAIVFISKQRKFIWRSCLHFEESVVFIHICYQ